MIGRSRSAKARAEMVKEDPECGRRQASVRAAARANTNTLIIMPTPRPILSVANA
jgi:hypothetical protein